MKTQLQKCNFTTEIRKKYYKSVSRLLTVCQIRYHF